MYSFREADDVFLQNQTRIWIGEVLQERLDEQKNVSELLADGELLFEVSKVMWEMCGTSCMKLLHIEVDKCKAVALRKSGGRFTPYSNVDTFLKVCKMLGLDSIDLFSPSDVVEMKDTRKVCMCIRSLSKKARSEKLHVPDFDIVTYTIAMPTDMVGCIRRSLEISRHNCMKSGNHDVHEDKYSRAKSKQIFWVADDPHSEDLGAIKINSMLDQSSIHVTDFENTPGAFSVIKSYNLAKSGSNSNFTSSEKEEYTQNLCGSHYSTNSFESLSLSYSESNELDDASSSSHSEDSINTIANYIKSQSSNPCKDLENSSEVYSVLKRFTLESSGSHFSNDSVKERYTHEQYIHKCGESLPIQYEKVNELDEVSSSSHIDSEIEYANGFLDMCKELKHRRVIQNLVHDLENDSTAINYIDFGIPKNYISHQLSISNSITHESDMSDTFVFHDEGAESNGSNSIHLTSEIGCGRIFFDNTDNEDVLSTGSMNSGWPSHQYDTDQFEDHINEFLSGQSDSFNFLESNEKHKFSEEAVQNMNDSRKESQEFVSGEDLHKGRLYCDQNKDSKEALQFSIVHITTCNSDLIIEESENCRQLSRSNIEIHCRNDVSENKQWSTIKCSENDKPGHQKLMEIDKVTSNVDMDEIKHEGLGSSKGRRKTLLKYVISGTAMLGMALIFDKLRNKNGAMRGQELMIHGSQIPKTVNSLQKENRTVNGVYPGAKFNF